MIYVTIDTNIYFDILLNQDEYDYNLKKKNYKEVVGNKDEKIEEGYRYRENKLPLTLIPLKILCENNVVRLIVTEITKLELEKHNARYMEDIKNGYKQLEEVIKKENMWSNIAYIKNDLQAVLEQNKKMNIENWKFGHERIRELLDLENNIQLELNADVICNLYRKNIAGLLGDANKEAEKVTKNNDYLFVNTIQEYFKDKKLENDYIFLITKDKKDFCGERKINYYELKENLKDNRVDVKVLVDMKSLYKLINGNVDIQKKINEKIDEVMDERRKDSEYSEESIWHNYVRWNEPQIKEEVLNEFAKKDRSLKEIKLLRKSTIAEIRHILLECRRLSFWDDRSEQKLFCWLEEYDEEDIELLSLSTLLIIKGNLQEYKKIHEPRLKE